jgi:predicted NBD/HSP70 family sugar kinase
MIVVPAQMRRLNARSFLERLQRMGTASRAELAKSLGMSQPTAGNIADDLLRLGVLEETTVESAPTATRSRSAASASARLGRPGRLLRLDRTHPRFLGIQLGLLETDLALLPVSAPTTDQWVARLKTPGSAAAWLRSLGTAAPKLGVEPYWGALVSVPGIVDENSGRILFSPNLHWTEKVDLPGMIRQMWNIPVILVQEERALALGHHLFDRSGQDFLLVDFGDGVGGSMIVNGKPYSSNPLPLNGELGHTVVRGNHRPCGCGAAGCLETLASTRGLLESFAVATRRTQPTWADLVAYVSDKGVVSWLAETLEATAVILSGALNVLGLRRIIITGSLTELPPPVMHHLTQAIVQGSMWARFGAVECENAPRRRTAGLIAVGLDRLVMPMAGIPGSNHSASPHVRH